MAEPLTPTLRPASQNPWYMLATARKDHAANRDLWNGYMRHLIGDAAAANLQLGYGTPIVLPILSPNEMEWITRNIPGLPQGRPEAISLSGLNFAAAVNFQDFYFPVSVDFSRSSFAGEATFTASTFAEYANFRGSSFGESAGFRESTFGERANFRGSTFAEYANFRKSTFGERADFEESTFAKYADFRKSIFTGDATFTGRIFKGEANFSNATYEGKTSFQNVTFTRAPLFFETTLHEDTDWTGITWPDKPEDKEDATQYVRRYDRLALIMSTLKQPDNEHQFFRLSMRAKEVHDGWGINIISTFSSYLYGRFFCYGWGFERALGLWFSIYSLVQVICGAWLSGR